jgi:hypothetical protein
LNYFDAISLEGFQHESAAISFYRFFLHVRYRYRVSDLQSRTLHIWSYHLDAFFLTEVNFVCNRALLSRIAIISQLLCRTPENFQRSTSPLQGESVFQIDAVPTADRFRDVNVFGTKKVSLNLIL